MRHGYRQLLAGVLLTGLALPACAGITVTTETMTGTGLPPGQTLPETPPQEAAPAAPFTPKTVSTGKMEAWGPMSSTTTPSESTTETTSSSSGSGTAQPKPAARQTDRMRLRIKEVPKKEVAKKAVPEKEVPEKEVPKIVNPVRKMP